MGILGSLGLEAATSAIGSIGTLAKDIRAVITGKEIIDPNKLAEIEAKTLELEQRAAEIQTEINKTEAASSSVFVAGWRPAVGWVCVFGLAYQAIINPTIEWVAKCFATGVTAPELDTQSLVTILMGMLGLGMYRTLEKKWGVSDKH